MFPQFLLIWQQQQRCSQVEQHGLAWTDLNQNLSLYSIEALSRLGYTICSDRVTDTIAEEWSHSAAADLAGNFSGCCHITGSCSPVTNFFCPSQAPMCLAVTFQWPRGHCTIFDNLSVTSGRLCDDREIILRNLAVISRIEGDHP